MLASPVVAAGVDWKWYGGGTDASAGVYCFYEANGITRPSSGYVRVWIKCLPRKDLERPLDPLKDEKFIRNTAAKIVEGYVPPIFAIEELDLVKRTAIVLYEAIANLSNIQPLLEAFNELNCLERMSRMLSMEVDGQKGTTPTGWEYASPESNYTNLLKLLCPIRR
jgi:hypothetical protein